MRLWALTLGAWLVLHGLSNIVGLNFQYQNLVMGVLAVVAGVFVIIRK